MGVTQRTYLEKYVTVRNPEAPAIRSLLVEWADSQLHYILSLQSLWALRNIKFDAVAFIQRLEARTLNGAVMDKNVIP
jgi:hypothetical protein